MAERTLTNGEAWRRTTVGSIVSGAVAFASVLGYYQVNPPRADPFTGSEGQALRLEIKKDLNQHEERIARRMEILQQNQADLWIAFSQLPPDRWRRRIEALEIETVKKNPNYEVPQ